MNFLGVIFFFESCFESGVKVAFIFTCHNADMCFNFPKGAKGVL